MAETTIETRFTLQDRLTAGINRVSGGVSALGKKFNQVSETAGKLNSVVGGIGGKLAMLGSAIGGTAILGNIIKISEEYENTSIKIAGTLRAFNLAPTIGLAQEQAKSAMATIQEMAATLPGETEEYITVFSTALPKAIEAGMRDITSIATFTSKWMALAASNTIDSMQAGMDLYRILGGQAGADVRMWSVIASQVGMTTDEFNKLAKAHPDQIIGRITEVLKKYDDQQGLAADSFSAKMGELQSRLKELQRIAGEELFTQAKTALDEMNKYLRENKDELVKFGREFLEQVIPALKQAVPIMKELLNHADDLTKAAIAFAGIWTAGTLIGAIDNIVKGFTAMRVVLAAINVEALAVVGAIYLLVEGVDKFAKGTADVATQAAKMQAGIWVEGGTPSAPKVRETYQKGDLDAATRRRISEEMKLRGTYAPMYEKLQKTIFGDVPEYAREYSAVHITEIDALREMYQSALVSPIKGAADEVVKFAMAMGWTQQTLMTAVAAATVSAAPKGKPATTPKGRTEQHFDFRNSRFDIKQEFAEGFDPDRIAVAFAQDLGRAGEMRTQSGFQQPYVGR